MILKCFKANHVQIHKSTSLLTILNFGRAY